jgi:UDP-N-acetylmuramate dehydrogenase
MTLRDAFPEITRPHVPLAPFTSLRVGGAAEFLVQPRSTRELAAVLKFVADQRVPNRILGVGSNIVVRDDGVSGAVVRLSEPVFTTISVEGKTVRAGGGALLADLISLSVKASLAGLETLVGIAATVGGAVRHNAGDRTGEIGQYVRRVEVLDARGAAVWREHEELRFAERQSNLDDPVILTTEFELDADRPDALVKRLLKAWIMRKARLPHSFEAAARMFANPRGLQAANLIEKAGLGKLKVGAAEVSERNPNFVVAAPGATARDVLALIDLIQTKVRDHCGVQLERDLLVW